MEIVIPKQDHGKRTDKYCENILSDVPRAQIRRMMRGGAILVNHEKVKTNFLLERGDVLFINDEDLKIVVKSKKNKQTIAEPKIVIDDENYLVIEKPSGLVVHPSKIEELGTLRDWLMKNYPKLDGVGENTLRPGIVHRLDKEVSGLMVIAKNKESYAHLKKQFQDHLVKKVYKALVHGKVLKEEGTIQRPIARSSRGHKMSARSKNHEGKEAITDYVVEKYLGRTQGENHGFSLLNVMPRTGRTHQIRVHMLSIGHPIVGDTVYYTRKQKRDHELNRLFLHAMELGFTDIYGKWRHYQSKLPLLLNKYLKSVDPPSLKATVGRSIS